MRREQIDSTIVDGLIVGDLANTLTVEDRVLLSEWVEQSDKNREYYLQLKQVLSVAAADEPSGVFDAEMAYHRFEQRLAQGSNVAKVRMPYFVTARRVMMFAASLLVVVAVSLFSFHFGERGVLEQLADVVVEAPIGSKAKVVLPDGSRVTLNAGSTISYAQDFGITERSCKLVGEAMFEVEKSPEKSFVVSTSGVDVKVLGTVFNVCNYDSDRRAIVTLLEGSVELETARSRRIMEVNQRAVINKESGVVRITNIDVSNSVAWTSNILYFDMEPLGDIAARLTRIYGVEIEFKSEAAKDLLFYGRFRSDKQSIKSVLSSFANTGKISYEFDGERVVIE